MSSRQTNAFRKRHGIPPLDLPETVVIPVEEAATDQVSPTVRARVKSSPVVQKKTGGCGGCRKSVKRPSSVLRDPDGRGPGSQLIKIFESAGAEKCQDCINLAADMDAWGVLVCRAKLETIVAEILPRAVEWEQKKLGWLGKLIPTAVTELTIRVLVDRAILAAEAVAPTMTWAYGVTTVPERFDDLLPKTLDSLKSAGFDDPQLFVDGMTPAEWVRDVDGPLGQHRATLRGSRIRTWGNWLLGVQELLIRNPEADRFAMFQDDFVTVRNLKEYLTKLEYPSLGYLNLYTFPTNERETDDVIYPAQPLKKGSLLPSGQQQTGYGAVALVFSREAVVTLLQQQTTVAKALRKDDAWRRVDGLVATAMNVAGWREYVHSPSLVQHTGTTSSMGNRRHPLATTFPGEDFDALELLKEQTA